MNIPTYCTNCDTSEEVKFVCRGCKFARFCSKECLKKCWKKHKRYCMPLNDAMNDSIEKIRPFLKNKYLINDEDLHCMFCLEGGTSEDPLFHSGCACRPDSGMSIGHIKCFQELARVSFHDQKKRETDTIRHNRDSVHISVNTSVVCGIGKCSHCTQYRSGILKFEMCLTLWKLHDPDCLVFTQQNVQNNAEADVILNALLCLDFALFETLDNGAHRDLITFCRLRILFSIKNVRKQLHNKIDGFRIEQEINDDKNIGELLLKIKKHQAAVDFNRRNYEKYLLNINKYPELARSLSSLIHIYAKSLFLAFMNAGNDPPHHYLEEAERLMRDHENCDDIQAYASNTPLLCGILIAQRKYAEAEQILSPCLQKAQRILGPSHRLTKFLLDTGEEIRLQSSSIST